MTPLKKTLKSGVEIEIQPAPFKEAHRLFKAVAEELKGVRLELGDLMAGVKRPEDLLKSDLTESTANTLKNLIATLVSSEKIEEALWPCMGRALYGGVRALAEAFEDEKARMDFIPTAQEVLLYNLRPFMSGLGSKFSGSAAEGNTGSQK